MPRSIEEIKADIARVQAQIAEQKQVPQPKTNVGWASYIMNDDPHLLDMYQNAERQWNQMQEQNKLTREISDANRAEQERYAMDDNMKNRSLAATNYEYARQAYEGDTSNDPRVEAQLKRDLDNSLTNYNYWNKRLGYKEEVYESKKKAAEGPSHNVKKEKWKNTKSFKTEKDKNDLLSELRSDAEYNTDAELTDIENNLMKIQSEEAKKAAEEAKKAEDAAADANFQKTGRFDKSKYKIEYTINGAKLVRKNK